MTNDELRALAAAAGVTPDEMSENPEYGLMLSPNGVRKLARRASDNQGKMWLIQQVQSLSPIAEK